MGDVLDRRAIEHHRDGGRSEEFTSAISMLLRARFGPLPDLNDLIRKLSAGPHELVYSLLGVGSIAAVRAFPALTND